MHDRPKPKVASKPAKRKPGKAPIEQVLWRHVKAGIRALQAYKGSTVSDPVSGKVHSKPGDRSHYYKFRDHKRRIYELLPGDERKARNIVRFMVAKSGWSSGPA